MSAAYERDTFTREGLLDYLRRNVQRTTRRACDLFYLARTSDDTATFPERYHAGRALFDQATWMGFGAGAVFGPERGATWTLDLQGEVLAAYEREHDLPSDWIQELGALLVSGLYTLPPSEARTAT